MASLPKFPRERDLAKRLGVKAEDIRLRVHEREAEAGEAEGLA